MTTGAVVAVAIAAIVLIALLVLVARRGRMRQLNERRDQAGRLRDEAQVRHRNAEREQAAADQTAAHAKQARAIAEEKVAEARRAEANAEAARSHARHESELAEEHDQRALAVDPDADDSDGSPPERRFERRPDGARRADGDIGTADHTGAVPREG